MPRIRTLKPQFWDSPSTAKADLAPRLLYMAMWNWADDSGRGTANLKELEAFAFPHDKIAELPRRSSGNSATVWRSFAELFWETVLAYGVTLYEVGGRRYYEICSFRDHQSKYFRPDSALPSPDDGQIWDVASEYGLDQPDLSGPTSGGSADSSGNSALSCRNPPQDRDRDRDRDRDVLRTPVRTQPPERQLPANKNGAALARQRFAAIPRQPSELARDITQSFSDAIGLPLDTTTEIEIIGIVDELLRTGQDPGHIAAGMHLWSKSDSFATSQIRRFVTKAAAQAAATAAENDDDKVSSWLATGASQPNSQKATNT